MGRRLTLELIAAVPSAAIIVVVTLYRIGVARTATSPGHADAAFYYGVAKNLHAGQGPQINYAWEFLSGEPTLPHYAFDYWLPLPSYLMSWALDIQNSLFAAECVTITMSVLLALGTYLFARVLTGSWWIPAASATLIIIQPFVTTFSLRLEGVLFLATFSTFALSFAVLARRYQWLWIVTGAFAGLANLSRSEGLLLEIALVVVALASVNSWRGAIRRGAFCLVGYLVVMSPFYVMTERHIGTLMPPASAKFPYVQTYEDLFSLHVDTSIGSLFPDPPWGFLRIRLSAIGPELSDAAHGLDIVTMIVMAIGIGAVLVLRRAPMRLAEAGSDGVESANAVPADPSAAHVDAADADATDLQPRTELTDDAAPPVRPRRRDWWLGAFRTKWSSAIFVGIVAEFFYVVIVPILSISSLKWVCLVAPAIIIAGLHGLDRLRLRPWVLAVFVALLITVPLFSVGPTSRGVVAANNLVGHTVATKWFPLLAAEQRCLNRPVVLMTRSPWEITQTTGIATVMIPNNSLADILAVAARYHATDLQLANRPALADRAALTGPGGPLINLTNTSKTAIFRLRQANGPVGCNGAKS